MAGPRITVEYGADLTKVKQATADVATAAKGSGASFKDAFGPGLDVLKNTGVFGPFQSALDGIGTAADAVKTHIKDIPAAMIGVGAGIAGIGVGLSQLGSKDQAAHQQLQASVEATGKAYDGFDQQVEDAIKHQEHFGNTASETQDALRILTQATGDPAKAMNYLAEASDLAAAKHESLTGAANQLGKAYNGNAKILKEFGVTADNTKAATAELQKATAGAETADNKAADAKKKLADLQEQYAGKSKLTVAEQQKLRDAQEAVNATSLEAVAAHEKLTTAQQGNTDATKSHADALDKLGQKLAGQASAQSDTFAGKLRGLKAAVEDNVAALGQKYGPALQGAGGAMAGLGAAAKVGEGAVSLMKNAALGTRIELMAMESAEKVAAAATWIFNAALDANPVVLIVLAIVGLIAILVLLATHVQAVGDFFSTLGSIAADVWGKILDAVTTVWNWITSNWPLLLDILLGPFGIAINLIINNFDTLKDIVMGVFDVIHTIIDSWVGRIEALFSNLIQWLVNTFSTVIAIISVPFEIARDLVVGAINGIIWIAGTIAGWIQAAVKDVITILSVPFGIARDIIAMEINGFLIVVGTIAGFVSNAVGWVAGILSGPFNVAKDIITGAISTIKNIVWSIGDAVSSAMSGLENIIAAPFRIASDIIHRIIDDIGSAVSKISGPISSVLGAAGKVGGFIAGLAEGGIVTKPTLAVIGEAGPEAVIPLGSLNPTVMPIPAPAGPAMGTSGPAVLIQEAHFHDEANVETFMRQAAWTARTAAL